MDNSTPQPPRRSTRPHSLRQCGRAEAPLAVAQQGLDARGAGPGSSAHPGPSPSRLRRRSVAGAVRQVPRRLRRLSGRLNRFARLSTTTATPRRPDKLLTRSCRACGSAVPETHRCHAERRAVGRDLLQNSRRTSRRRCPAVHSSSLSEVRTPRRSGPHSARATERLKGPSSRTQANARSPPVPCCCLLRPAFRKSSPSLPASANLFLNPARRWHRRTDFLERWDLLGLGAVEPEEVVGEGRLDDGLISPGLAWNAQRRIWNHWSPSCTRLPFWTGSSARLGVQTPGPRCRVRRDPMRSAPSASSESASASRRSRCAPAGSIRMRMCRPLAVSPSGK